MQSEIDGSKELENRIADELKFEDDESDDAARERHRSNSDAEPSKLWTFTPRHCRRLTQYLTHVHLPGLSSVDQMHLLAVADTVSSFSADAIDKLAHVNAGMSFFS